MTSSECDGSWILNVLITDKNIERSIRVKSDLHIGGVMLKLVESIDSKDQVDWSDHSFYWSEKSLWLTRAKTTLEQYGVQADVKLWFTPMHKNIQIQLPDLRVPIFRVNFSINVFNVVIRLCRELGIRHPEELSLLRKLEARDLKHNQGISGTRSSNKLPTGLHASSMNASNPALDEIRTPGLLTPEGTLSRGPLTAHPSPLHPFNANGMQTPGSMDSLEFDAYLTGSHSESIAILPNLQPKAKNLSEMARLNSAWLDSSRSLMEQGVKDDDVILLRFKFLDFYDLNAKYDPIRIHHIFEQAKCSIISEELTCSEDEMVVLAALQAQVEKRMNNFGPGLKQPEEPSEDEIDSALCDLQISLEGHREENVTNLTKTPQLKNWMKCCRPRKFHMKSFKRYWFVLRDQYFTIFSSDLEGEDNMLHEFNLSGSEGFSLSPMCSVPSEKFLIKLFLQRNKAPIELWLRPDHEEQYVKWLAALRLIQQGRTMADMKSFEEEKKSIESLLDMQRESESGHQPDLDPADLKPEQMFAPRFLNKSKMKQLLQRTVNTNSNMKEMSKIEAQLNYIKAWQMLPSFGFKYFIINVKNSKKEELLGIGTDRLVKMDIKKGDILKTWMYKTIKTWSVNWEFKQVQVSFEEEAELAFQCLTAGCKVIHEFIGGYIFLSMRSGDKSQTLDDELFHKLTGGWV